MLISWKGMWRNSFVFANFFLSLSFSLSFVPSFLPFLLLCKAVVFQCKALAKLILVSTPETD